MTKEKRWVSRAYGEKGGKFTTKCPCHDVLWATHDKKLQEEAK